MRRFLLARFADCFARSLVTAMLSYHVFVATESYAALGLLGLVEFLPLIPVALLGGLFADRFDRRALLIVSTAAALLGAATLACLGWQRPDDVPWLFAVALLLSATTGFSSPPSSSLLPNLVPREIFQNAAVVSSGVIQFAFISGPITMGFMVGPLGFGAPYALAAGSQYIYPFCRIS